MLPESAERTGRYGPAGPKIGRQLIVRPVQERAGRIVVIEGVRWR